ncbi:hypothetical protein [Oceanobacter mangrovi]|uniref:hypothetical protein n=1 Tax=Oceanobacter mangrovi TaxID=2862510 RepID=UPI001C8D5DE8|nr:hypothetical protein [Oceanobacter mangrovi]
MLKAVAVKTITAQLVLAAMAVWTQTANADEWPARYSWGWHFGLADSSDGQSWQSLLASAAVIVPGATPKWRLSATVGVVESSSQRSLADSWLSVTRLGQQRHLGQWWDLQWKLKLPTADASKGLGTGGVDNELRVQSLARLANWIPWYYVGYRWRGSSDYYRLQNGFSWGAGVSWYRWNISYSGRQSSLRDGPVRHTWTLGRQLTIAERRFSPYISISKAVNTQWGVGFSSRF